MFTKNGKSLEDRVLSELKNGPVEPMRLVARISQQRKGTTKQGVYAILRTLKKHGVVVMNRKEVLLNNSWLLRVEEFAAIAQHSYHSPNSGIGHIANLQDGEKVEYTFQNSKNADVFLDHAVLFLSQLVPTSEPLFSYSPHGWFFITRPEIERQFFKRLSQQFRLFLMTAHGRMVLDRSIKSEFDGIQRQYHICEKPLWQNEGYHLHVMGPIVIEWWIDPQTANRINEFYERTTALTPTTREQLQQIVAKRRKTRCLISRDQRTASVLKKTLMKPFYVPTYGGA